MAELASLTSAHLRAAQESSNGRSAELLIQDGALRQSILALREGTQLAEHNSPHAASMQVLVGRVRVTGQDEAEISAGELQVLTHQRHGVTALEDAVFLLTTVTSQPGSSHGA